MSARAFIGAGSILVARYDVATAAFLDYAGPYQTNKFEIKAASDLKEAVSKDRTDYGSVIEAVSIPKPVDFSIEFTEVNSESLAMAFLGDVTALSQASGTLTAEAVTVKLNAWKQISVQNLGDAIVVKDSTDTTTFVEGTDYELNRALGMIKALSTGALTDNEVVHISGPYNAISGSKISGNTNSQIRAKLIFDGINLVDGQPCIVRCPEAILTPNAGFDFLATDFNKVPLTGRLKKPTGATEPFSVELRG